jgi:hypothetical protein
MKGFRGCGSVWLPSTPGEHFLDAHAWIPVSDGLAGLRGVLTFSMLFSLAVLSHCSC